MPPSIENTVIRASAGSGKTYQLSNRFLELASGGVGVETIFAATFSRKAAGEILDRILVRMAKAATEESERLELCRALDKDPAVFDHATILDLLVRTVRVLHRLNVSTLDSFFVKVAEAFSFELELPGGWSISDELNQQRYLEEAVRRVVASMPATETVSLMHMLNKGESTRSVRTQLLTLAEKLIEIYRDSEPDAWRKLPRRTELGTEELDDLLQRYNNAPLPAHGSAPKAHREEYNLLAAGDWDGFLSKGFGKKVLSGDYTYNKAKIEGELATVIDGFIDHVMAQRINRIATQTEATGRILAKIAEAFEDVKREERVLLFGDVTYRLAHPPRDIAEETLVHRIDARMRHMLLDEFQDTSPAQWDVLRGFVDIALGKAATPPSKGNSPGKGTFFCVGDVKQAIYAWRGGVSAIFDTVEDDVDGLRQETLQVSWRSAPAVIETVNRFFGSITKNAFLIDTSKYSVDPTAAKNWHRGFETHRSAPKNANLSGYCVLESAPLAGTPEAERLFADWQDLDAAEDFDNAAEDGDSGPADRKQDAVTLAYAVERIARLHKQKPFCRIGVLTRRNETIARLIYGLRRAGIDASEEGGNPLTDSAAVELILSALTLADHPGNTVVQFHLVSSRLGKYLGLANAAENAGTESPLPTKACSARVALSIRRRILRDGFGPTLQDWARILAADCDDRELSRMLQLLEKAHLYDAKKGNIRRCDAFVEYIRSERVNKPRVAPVRVMTIHQSKGLEFDIVVLPELQGGLVGSHPLVVTARPSPKAPYERVVRYADVLTRRFLPPEYQKMFENERKTRIEEALCVLYVAMTRARRELVMIVPGKAVSQKPPAPRKTFEGILRSGLVKDYTQDRPGSVLFEHGDPNWFDAEALARTASTPENEGLADSPGDAVETLDLLLAPAPERPRRMLRRYTPSSHDDFTREAGAAEIETSTFPVEPESPDISGGAEATVDSGDLFLKRDELLPADLPPRDRRIALLYGTAMHAAFELVGWLDVETPQREAVEQALLRVFQAELPPEEAKVRTDAALEDFFSLCERPDIRDALSLDGRDPGMLRIFRERPFLISYKDGLMRGSIDRLVLYLAGSQNEAEIIDFKTDRLGPDPRERQERAAGYASQLEAYRAAVSKLYGIEPTSIRTRLLFTSPNVKNI